MKMTLTFEGGQDLAAALGALPLRVGLTVAREALAEAGEPMRGRMAQLAPHEPGKPDLRDAMVISAVRRSEGSDPAAVAVGPTKAGFYGSFHEYGTRFMPARPWARPAFDEMAPESLRILSAALWRELTGRGIARTGSSVVPLQGEV